MKRYNTLFRVLILSIFIPFAIKVLGIECPTARAGQFVAYSMEESKRLLKSNKTNRVVEDLGGITDIVGMVYDDVKKDLIVVGQVNEGKPTITLQDFVVAIRAVFIHQRTPLVSIDPNPQTAVTRKQSIHWEGGIENTKLGKDMLEADILLKKFALGTISTEIWGLKSYSSITAEAIRKGKVEGNVGSRFWFKNLRPSLAVREGVFAIMDLHLGVETEVLYAELGGERVTNIAKIRDDIGDSFAEQVALNLSDLSVEYPVLARAKPILALVSLAEGMKSLVGKAELDYWLHEYRLSQVKTAEEHDLIEVKQRIEERDLVLTVSGGIELNPIVVKLKKGHVTALKEAVLNSRPPGNVLVWNPPLEGWHIPGMENIEIDPTLVSAYAKKTGFSIDRVISKTATKMVTLNITDFGINQKWKGLKTGDDFTLASNKVFNDIPKRGQILIVMPPDNSFRNMTTEQMTKEIYKQVIPRINEGLATGNKDFEIQIVQNINKLGYFDPNRQKLVNDFGEVAYKAIGMINDNIKTKGLSTNIYGYLGSNGTKIFNENISAWKSYKSDWRHLNEYDGRASKSSTIDMINELGAEKVHGFNTRGDLPAPNDMPFAKDSIGNHDVLKEVKKDIPGFQVTLLDPIDRPNIFGFGHIAGMSGNSRFLAKDYNTDDSYTPPQKVTGSDYWNSFQQKSTPTFNSGIHRNPLPPPRAEIPKFDIYKDLPSQRITHDVGGVMLQGVARIAGDQERDAKVDLTGGNFSLVVDGENARLDPDTFRKFVTALWSVYYSNQDPGISIDPIAPGSKKHVVRYIGKVTNTDLGRVMREADYIMKKWAVGTGRPNITGFENPDDVAARSGVKNIGAWSRFWFVPEEMKFRRGGDMLLFDTGRMTVKTEYMFKNDGMKADPSNETFARFFTEHYNEIAEEHPVYKELFEYAKMVSLAKYLKEKGVPLYWFLMANKDLVITEDSPGTVDALIKASEHFKGIEIEGGVNLDFKVEDDTHYVYDKEAVSAINEAISKRSASANVGTSLPSDKRVIHPFSFDLGKSSYTVVPQHSLTSGKDRRGTRYQTDVALRGTGFQLTEQVFARLRAEIVYSEVSAELIPYMKDMESMNEDKALSLYEKALKHGEAEAEKTLKRLERLKDLKYTSEDEFSKALEAMIGKAQTEKLKPLILKHAYFTTSLELVRYYDPKQQGSGQFGKGWHLLIPYRIEPVGDKKKEFLNVLIPEKIAVINLLTGDKEVLTFNADRYKSAAYIPEKEESSQVIGLVLMTDTSYRLEDKLGNRFGFDPSGRLTDLIFSEDHHFQIEYLDRMTSELEKPPYKLQPDGEDRVDFRNVRLPQRMKVMDLINGGDEILTFSQDGRIAGYKPENENGGRYRFIALMTDTSYRLLDKEGNEAAFDAGGEFRSMFLSASHPIIKSISQGTNKVQFKYTVNILGEFIIASAYLIENGDSSLPTYVVHYQYDGEGRLYNAKRIDNTGDKFGHDERDSIITAGR